MTVQVDVTPGGQLRLPDDILNRLGPSNGGPLFLEETPKGVVLRTAGQAAAPTRALAKKFADQNGDASVDAFIARRPKESGE